MTKQNTFQDYQTAKDIAYDRSVDTEYNTQYVGTDVYIVFYNEPYNGYSVIDEASLDTYDMFERDWILQNEVCRISNGSIISEDSPTVRITHTERGLYPALNW